MVNIIDELNELPYIFTILIRKWKARANHVYATTNKFNGNDRSNMLQMCCSYKRTTKTNLYFTNIRFIHSIQIQLQQQQQKQQHLRPHYRVKHPTHQITNGECPKEIYASNANEAQRWIVEGDSEM